LENLHLADDWLPSFEEKISKWKGAELNPRFRVWITCIPVDNFPPTILERSIKVALQPPRNIKSKIQRMLLDQEKETFFRKSGKNSGFHKNLFFGLAYFHSIMDSRGQYGTLGWHVPYKFDFSDFDISNAQLAHAMKHNSGDLLAALEMLKYYFSQINYAGKIQRPED
jgi:dynein heavy chain, axonemal